MPEAERRVDGGAGVGAVVVDGKDGLGPERVRVEPVRQVGSGVSHKLHQVAVRRRVVRKWALRGMPSGACAHEGGWHARGSRGTQSGTRAREKRRVSGRKDHNGDSFETGRTGSAETRRDGAGPRPSQRSDERNGVRMKEPRLQIPEDASKAAKNLLLLPPPPCCKGSTVRQRVSAGDRLVAYTLVRRH